ncbi:dynamin family protein [Marinococcus luteus]|uniref:dynamin family protein n=1 Tax=Marinococcus luteus TaxID=1122204 RepID=UPI002ACCBA89|nr:dynamin family protein [Marinococcus luteus]MDZ5783375.1 dynamin family protein [Marinococcus luteus]
MINALNEKIEKTAELITEATNEEFLSKNTIEAINFEQKLERLENGTFKVGVVAPFSVGKSTFINSLLEFDLLSTSILVETAAITTVKYGEKSKVEINYRSGERLVLPKEEEPIEDIADLKQQLKMYTTINRNPDGEGVKVEEEIQSVNVYWPLDLCKNGTEIVDTPGLFAQYSGHNEITSEILMEINAVIFLIDPSTIGQANFMRVIKEYVENAKRSTIDGTGKHIFFAINKIDQHPDSEVTKAYEELFKMLEPIVEEPKVFKVSSYFGLIAGLYKQGYINIDDIRKDETIKFVDDDGFPVSGREIQKEDMEIIESVSQISQVKESLEQYFEEKNYYLIEEALSALKRACELELQENEETEYFLQDSLAGDRIEFKKKIEIIQEKFGENVREIKKELEREVEKRIRGGASKNSFSLLRELKKLTEKKIESLSNDWRRQVQKEWRINRFNLTSHNAEEIVGSFINYVDLTAETVKKTLIQEVFELLEKQMTKIIEDFEEKFMNLEKEFNELFYELLGMKLSGGTLFFAHQELINQVKEEINDKFKGNSAVYIQTGIDKKINKERSKAIKTVRSKGVLNFFKSWVGKGQYEEYLEEDKYLEGIEKVINLFIEEMYEEVQGDILSIDTELNNEAEILAENILKENVINNKISAYESWKQSQLEKLEENYQKSEAETNESLIELEVNKKLLNTYYSRVEDYYEEIMN